MADHEELKPKTPRTQIRERVQERKAEEAVAEEGSTAAGGNLFASLCCCLSASATATKSDGVNPLLIKKVHKMWASGSKDADGIMERLACWDYILNDEELKELVGDGDSTRGRATLQAMKAVKALDQINSDGRITEGTFYGYPPDTHTPCDFLIDHDHFMNCCDTSFDESRGVLPPIQQGRADRRLALRAHE